MQLGWLIWMLDLEDPLPWGAAAGIGAALSVLAAGLVHVAQGPERPRFYATSILSSCLTWALWWGLIGIVAGEVMGAQLFEEAGIVMGPLAGTVFGCLIALRARTEPGSVPELLVLGTMAGTLIGLALILSSVLGLGSCENCEGMLMAFAILGALGGIASVVAFAARRITLST